MSLSARGAAKNREMWARSWMCRACGLGRRCRGYGCGRLDHATISEPGTSVGHVSTGLHRAMRQVVSPSSPRGIRMSEPMTTPLVSIGIPVYNGARFIRQALDHLLAQTYTHLELVICDNASTDDTGAICQAYAARDARVRYYRNPTNVGLINNFRLAVERSTGTYFTWAAVDDRKLPTAVEACVRALQAQPEAVMVHGIVLVQSPGRDDLVPFPNAVDLAMPDTAARIRAFTAGITHNAIFYAASTVWRPYARYTWAIAWAMIISYACKCACSGQSPTRRHPPSFTPSATRGRTITRCIPRCLSPSAIYSAPGACTGANVGRCCCVAVTSWRACRACRGRRGGVASGRT